MKGICGGLGSLGTGESMGVWDPKGIPDGPIDSLSSARSREICNLFDPMIQESVAHPRPPQIPFANLGGMLYDCVVLNVLNDEFFI